MENERRQQVKIINKLMDINCPRLNNNCVVFRRNLRHEYWPGVIRLIPRVSCRKKKKKKQYKVLRFFQAQLRLMKKKGKLKKKKKKGKLSSNQIISKNHYSVKYQFTSPSSCPVLTRHRMVVGNRLLLSELPKELLAQILVRLPVKYILRCMCVLKSWNSFIKSTEFVTLHLNYHKQQNVNHHLPKYLLFDYQSCFRLTIRFDDLQCEEYRRLEFLPGVSDGAWFAPSYGLICASTILDTHGDKVYDRKIYLWNPLINKYKTLPKSPFPSTQNSEAWQALAFGFLPQHNDYVVIHVTKPCLPPHPHSVIIGVYSLNTNSWKISSQDNVFISNISGNDNNVVFNNGAAFWVGTNSNKQIILMCFDTKTNVLSEISLPDSVTSWACVPFIHAFGQSIAYFIWEEGVIHFDMWVLNYNYTNEFTWEKKMCVSPSKDVLEEVLGVRNNGEPILVKSQHLISYNLDSHRPSGFVDSWDRWTPNYPYRGGSGPPFVIRPFVESLVMLNND